MFYNFRYSIHAIVRIDHINGYKSLYFDADIKKCPTEEIKINLKMLGRYRQMDYVDRNFLRFCLNDSNVSKCH